MACDENGSYGIFSFACFHGGHLDQILDACQDDIAHHVDFQIALGSECATSI